MKTIVAPTDFSPTSINAVNYAADLAMSVNASLYLLHVSQLPMTVSEVPISAELIESIQKNAEDKMHQLKEEINKRTGEKLKIYCRLKIGTVLHEIEDLCNSVKPFAVVMGAQGSSAVNRFILGSNTIAAIKHIAYPLIAVPEHAKFNGIKKIGLACDFKKVIETTPAKEIKLLVKDFNAEFFVVHVNEENDPAYLPEKTEQSAFLQEMLNDLHPSYQTLDNPYIEDGLHKYIQRKHLDMLIVIPKRHNILEKIFHKSFSKELILHTHIPIMAIHG